MCFADQGQNQWSKKWFSYRKIQNINPTSTGLYDTVVFEWKATLHLINDTERRWYNEGAKNPI